jgi:multiple sugar transport system substrate-binding protein
VLRGVDGRITGAVPPTQVALRHQVGGTSYGTAGNLTTMGKGGGTQAEHDERTIDGLPEVERYCWSGMRLKGVAFMDRQCCPGGEHISSGPDDVANQAPPPQSTPTKTALGRRDFLARSAKVAAGLAAGGALLDGPAAALAAPTQLRTFNINRATPVTLTFTIFGTAAQTATWNQLAALFHTKNPGITVNVIPYAGNTWSEYFEKILTQIAGGHTPDIIRIATEGARLFGARDLALPLDDFIKRDHAEIADFLNDVHPKLLNTFKIDGKVLALPFEWNDIVMFYNTKVFKDLGITPPSANWTGDDFRAICQKIKKSGPWGYAIPTGANIFPLAWEYAGGGLLLNADTTKSNALDPANVTGLQFLQNLVFKDKTTPRPGLAVEPLLAAGRIAMFSAGRFSVQPLLQSHFNTFDVQSMPVLGPHPKTVFGAGGHPIYKHSKHPEEAWTFLKFMCSRTAGSYLTKLGFANPSRRSLANDASLMTPPKNYRIFYGLLDQAVPLPAPVQDNDLEDAYYGLYTKLMANEISASDMMKTLDPKIKTILAKHI